MSPDPNRVEAVFAAALALAVPEQRVAFLDGACPNDPVLRARVDALLQAHLAAGSFLQAPAPGLAATVDERHQSEGPGTHIGPYKLLQQLGEGGMGIVFLAEQQKPFRRLVALKIIKHGLDSGQIVARFESERQALALMDHPNIAKVFDAGATDSGRPYFVMELIKGIPITRFCDQELLTPRERLALFIPVCQAVQHAHQKGVIHRDLKPSNVLIARYDGKPVPKVIDFGVAKATSQKLTERTLFTEVGSMVGTLEYMAPEQAELNNLDIDTRADIYSLGVLLYELLTGSPPFSAKALRSNAFAEMLRIIREVEPPRPSTKLSSSQELPAIAARRKLEPGRLTSQVQGDLDWIVMKCLEKERGRRYETANAVVRDIQRYLTDEPVQAGPPSAGYRLRKFVKRNRGTVTAAVVVLLTLVVGIVGTTWGLVWALGAEAETRAALVEVEEKRDQAARAVQEAKRSAAVAEERRQAAANAEQQAKKSAILADERRREAERQTGVAQQEKKRAEAVRDYLVAVFRRSDPEVDSRRVTVAEVLNEGVARATVELRDQPIVQADMFEAIGHSFLGLGLFKEGAEVLERAEQIRLKHLGKNHRDTLRGRNRLAWAYLVLGLAEKSVALNEELLALARKLPAGEEYLTVAIMNHLASGYEALGRYREAVNLFEEALKVSRKKFGPDHEDVLILTDNLARAYQFANRLPDAVPLFEEVLKRRLARLPNDHPYTLRSKNSLGYAYLRSGRAKEALPLLVDAVRGRKDKLGPNHPKTLMSMDNLAQTYWQLKNLKEAIPLFEETLEKRRAILSPDHPDSRVTLSNLAGAYQVAGRTAAAIKLYEELRDQEKNIYAPDHPYTLHTLQNLASLLQGEKEFDRAAAVWRQLLAAQGRKLPNDHPAQLGIQAVLGLCLVQAGKFSDAEPILRDCLKIREQKQPDAWTTFNTRSMLGGALLGQKKYADAEPLLLTGFAGIKQRAAQIPPPGQIRLTEAVERLVQFYDATGNKDEAAKWRKELETIQTAQKKLEKQP